jgi:glycosyltransferase involved in cell wall biosynthesis
MNPIPLEQLAYGLKLVHGLTSPSQVILDDWQHLQSVRRWVPNYYHPRFYRSKPVPHEGIIIGWAGSATHLNSWRSSGIAEGLRQVMKKYDNVFLAIGGDKRAFSQVDVQPARKLFIAGTPYALFHETLSRFDIGVIPLAGEYDRRRSFIKTLEYTAMGIPWAGTDWEPNREIRTGTLVANTADAWFDALDNLIANYAERKVEIGANKHLAERYDITKNARCIVNAYKDIYSLAKAVKVEEETAELQEEEKNPPALVAQTVAELKHVAVKPTAIDQLLALKALR